MTGKLSNPAADAPDDAQLQALADDTAEEPATEGPLRHHANSRLGGEGLVVAETESAVPQPMSSASNLLDALLARDAERKEMAKQKAAEKAAEKKALLKASLAESQEQAQASSGKLQASKQQRPALPVKDPKTPHSKASKKVACDVLMVLMGAGASP